MLLNIKLLIKIKSDCMQKLKILDFLHKCIRLGYSKKLLLISRNEVI